MKDASSVEKVKPFRLVKYFTITSLIVIFVGALVLSALNTHWARKMLLKKSEDYALLLVENLNHQIFLQFILPVYFKYGKIQLGNKEQFEMLDKVVRSTLHSFKVDMMNIYDYRNDMILYSFDEEQVGKKNIGGTDYLGALSGKTTSKLVQSGNAVKNLFAVPQKSKIVTFAPLRGEQPLSVESGPILGVVEIVQNLSEDYKTIFEFQIRVVITCTIVMGLLFIILFFVVQRGESIIQRRALERLRLEEKLRRAEHLSALGEMVAAVSHEIRNPLGIISSSAELLKKKTSGENTLNNIPDIIVEESVRLNHIITDFLNFAKPRTPGLIPCRISEVLEKNITYLASQIQEQGYSVENQYENDIPEIRADPDMLYQAFLNILINAMQAMPQGGIIDVDIRLSNNTLYIYIGDEGEGIPENLIEKIWDPFFTTKDKGTGLGLGIVKNIIEAHHGSITIENKPVRGAIVIVELPFE
ncbi:MAG: GHKL domain-containing protein [Deltaproteobacteria bacterium]|nr:GHKL domain-containing protein [Deltaproteobacteria bacterium]